MREDTVVQLRQPGSFEDDPLTDTLSRGRPTAPAMPAMPNQVVPPHLPCLPCQTMPGLAWPGLAWPGPACLVLFGQKLKTPRMHPQSLVSPDAAFDSVEHAARHGPAVLPVGFVGGLVVADKLDEGVQFGAFSAHAGRLSTTRPREDVIMNGGWIATGQDIARTAL